LPAVPGVSPGTHRAAFQGRDLYLPEGKGQELVKRGMGLAAAAKNGFFWFAIWRGKWHGYGNGSRYYDG
jgi:hypothetical protein